VIVCVDDADVERAVALIAAWQAEPFVFDGEDGVLEA